MVKVMQEFSYKLMVTICFMLLFIMTACGGF